MNIYEALKTGKWFRRNIKEDCFAVFQPHCDSEQNKLWFKSIHDGEEGSNAIRLFTVNPLELSDNDFCLDAEDILANDWEVKDD